MFDLNGLIREMLCGKEIPLDFCEEIQRLQQSDDYFSQLFSIIIEPSLDLTAGTAFILHAYMLIKKSLEPNPFLSRVVIRKKIDSTNGLIITQFINKALKDINEEDDVMANVAISALSSFINICDTHNDNIFNITNSIIFSEKSKIVSKYHHLRFLTDVSKLRGATNNEIIKDIFVKLISDPIITDRYFLIEVFNTLSSIIDSNNDFIRNEEAIVKACNFIQFYTEQCDPDDEKLNDGILNLIYAILTGSYGTDICPIETLGTITTNAISSENMNLIESAINMWDKFIDYEFEKKKEALAYEKYQLVIQNLKTSKDLSYPYRHEPVFSNISKTFTQLVMPLLLNFMNCEEETYPNHTSIQIISAKLTKKLAMINPELVFDFVQQFGNENNDSAPFSVLTSSKAIAHLSIAHHYIRNILGYIQVMVDHEIKSIRIAALKLLKKAMKYKCIVIDTTDTDFISIIESNFFDPDTLNVSCEIIVEMILHPKWRGIIQFDPWEWVYEAVSQLISDGHIKQAFRIFEGFIRYHKLKSLSSATENFVMGTVVDLLGQIPESTEISSSLNAIFFGFLDLLDISPYLWYKNAQDILKIMFNALNNSLIYNAFFEHILKIITEMIRFVKNDISKYMTSITTLVDSAIDSGQLEYICAGIDLMANTILPSLDGGFNVNDVLERVARFQFQGDMTIKLARSLNAILFEYSLITARPLTYHQVPRDTEPYFMAPSPRDIKPDFKAPYNFHVVDESILFQIRDIYFSFIEAIISSQDNLLMNEMFQIVFAAFGLIIKIKQIEKEWLTQNKRWIIKPVSLIKSLDKIEDSTLQSYVQFIFHCISLMPKATRVSLSQRTVLVSCLLAISRGVCIQEANSVVNEITCKI